VPCRRSLRVPVLFHVFSAIGLTVIPQLPTASVTSATPLPCSTRRDLLRTAGCGFASLAMDALAAKETSLPSVADAMRHVVPRAKRIIFVFMQGGPSHVDSFDWKPELHKRHEQTIDFTGVRFGTFGKVSQRTLMKPLWKFRPGGECGHYVSDLFPHLRELTDEMCVLQGMHTEGVAHGPATLFLHTGSTVQVRPSLGSWVLYGLGSENRNLPGFISLQPSDANGGPRNFGQAFLPARFQGTPVSRASQPASRMNIQHIRNSKLAEDELAERYDLTRKLNELQASRAVATKDAADAVLRSYELAWQMQSKAPPIFDLSQETAATADMYGIGQDETDAFGRQCLLARRLSESGVRFIQVNYADNSANPRWDQHSNMPRHKQHAQATDKPVAGLIRDLKQRGLLEDTLVWWGGEFGRTPFSQSNNGRDHNPRGFSVFLAGGGVRPGMTWGSTDEIGHHAVEGRVHMHDLHATVLHLLGLDHEQLTFQHAGRQFRPTDVYGRVVHQILS